MVLITEDDARGQAERLRKQLVSALDGDPLTNPNIMKTWTHALETELNDFIDPDTEITQ